MKTIQALILLHQGFEEMEAVAPIDLLSRAGVEVSLASMTEEKLVRGRSDLVVQATHRFDEVCADDYDAIILPGGPGVKALRQHPALCEFLKRHHAQAKILACICAAPLLLLDAGLLPENYTAHPSTLPELPQPIEKDHVWDQGILTSRGAGTATQFSLALIEALICKETRDQIAESICWS